MSNNSPDKPKVNLTNSKFDSTPEKSQTNAIIN